MVKTIVKALNTFVRPEQQWVVGVIDQAATASVAVMQQAWLLILLALTTTFENKTTFDEPKGTFFTDALKLVSGSRTRSNKKTWNEMLSNSFTGGIEEAQGVPDRSLAFLAITMQTNLRQHIFNHIYKPLQRLMRAWLDYLMPKKPWEGKGKGHKQDDTTAATTTTTTSEGTPTQAHLHQARAANDVPTWSVQMLAAKASAQKALSVAVEDRRTDKANQTFKKRLHRRKQVLNNIKKELEAAENQPPPASSSSSSSASSSSSSSAAAASSSSSASASAPATSQLTSKQRRAIVSKLCSYTLRRSDWDDKVFSYLPIAVANQLKALADEAKQSIPATSRANERDVNNAPFAHARLLYWIMVQRSVYAHVMASVPGFSLLPTAGSSNFLPIDAQAMSALANKANSTIKVNKKNVFERLFIEERQFRPLSYPKYIRTNGMEVHLLNPNNDELPNTQLIMPVLKRKLEHEVAVQIVPRHGNDDEEEDDDEDHNTVAITIPQGLRASGNFVGIDPGINQLVTAVFGNNQTYQFTNRRWKKQSGAIKVLRWRNHLWKKNPQIKAAEEHITPFKGQTTAAAIRDHIDSATTATKTTNPFYNGVAWRAIRFRAYSMKKRAVHKITEEMLNTFGHDAVIGFGAAIFPTSYKGVGSAPVRLFANMLRTAYGPNFINVPEHRSSSHHTYECGQRLVQSKRNRVFKGKLVRCAVWEVKHCVACNQTVQRDISAATELRRRLTEAVRLALN